MEFFDTHAHYNDEQFDEDRQDIIDKLYKDGITKVVVAGYSLQSSKKSIEISNQVDYMYSTCGISPNDIPDNMEELEIQLKQIEEIIENNKVVAVGEIGLDYHWNTENKDLQKAAFRKQIQIAIAHELPIVIHTREAVQDTVDILKEYPNLSKKGVFHCCPLNKYLIEEGLKLGFYISFAGPITFKNSKNADEMISIVPLDKILIETDSPYLAPEPNRGKRNDSRNVKYVAQKIADVKQISLEEISRVTYQNAKKIFEIE